MTLLSIAERLQPGTMAYRAAAHLYKSGASMTTAEIADELDVQYVRDFESTLEKAVAEGVIKKRYNDLGFAEWSINRTANQVVEQDIVGATIEEAPADERPTSGPVYESMEEAAAAEPSLGKYEVIDRVVELSRKMIMLDRARARAVRSRSEPKIDLAKEKIEDTVIEIRKLLGDNRLRG